MPHVKIWVHFVWSTKDRHPFLTKEIRSQLFPHIYEKAKEKDIFIDQINGHIEHVHCLISLGFTQSVSNIAHQLKGESSHWINQNKLCQTHFGWQDDYFAVSVSESMVDKVRAYIKNQEEHHRHKTFEEEYEEFIKNYGFDNNWAKAQ